MSIIQLGYGRDTVDFEFDPSRFEVLAPPELKGPRLSDADIGQALDTPIACPPLSDLVEPGDRVLIVASDGTRATASAQTINLVVRRLIENGITPSDLAIIFATGIHRPVTPAEKAELLTPFIVQRIRTIDHDAYDASSLVELDAARSGTPIRVNRALTDFDKIIITGGVGFHYFAGFTGGRKAICPGLASAETIEATHMLALDFENGGRRAGVGPGLLDGNAVNSACERVAALINPAFSVQAIVNDRGIAEKVFAGHWREAHRQACHLYATEHSIAIPEKREVVIVSCGGAPYDINMIQAHKALDMAAQACSDEGTIIFLAQCPDGLGRRDFLKWFEEPDSRALENRLRDGYEVNGQTAWALLTKTERFRVHLITDLSDDEARKLRMIPVRAIEAALGTVPQTTKGYIMPRGAALLPAISA